MEADSSDMLAGANAPYEEFNQNFEQKSSLPQIPNPIVLASRPPPCPATEPSASAADRVFRDCRSADIPARRAGRAYIIGMDFHVDRVVNRVLCAL
jgi:hypothetical protein